MHLQMKQQLAADHLAELHAEAQRARQQRARRAARRSSEAGRALVRREWRGLVHALLAR